MNNAILLVASAGIFTGGMVIQGYSDVFMRSSNENARQETRRVATALICIGAAGMICIGVIGLWW
jgi:hypothetical protein